MMRKMCAWFALAGIFMALAACGTRTHLGAGGSSLEAGDGLGSTPQGTASTPGASAGSAEQAATSSAPLPNATASSGAGTQTDFPTTTAPGSVGPAGLALTGRGWDKQFVHVGVTTTKDISTVGQSLGVKSINAGDLEADARAMVKWLNSHGGLLGRQIKPDFYNVSTSSNPDSVGQSICTHFTQDVHVVALINLTTNGDTPAFDECIAKAHLPTFAWITDTGDDKFFAGLSGYYRNMPFPSWSRFAGPFAKRLAALGYFTGWNTASGAPGPASAKVGLIEPDSDTGHRIATLLINALAAVGHAPAKTDVFFFRSEGDLTNASAKFRANGVTHVIGDELLFLFLQTFETQHYRPRLGINSSNAPSLFLEGTTPKAQLAGSMGVGTTPTIDVHAGHDPGSSAVPGVAQCNAIYQADKLEYPSDQRYAYTNMYGMCDGFRLIVSAAQSAGALNGPAIRDALGKVGGRVPTALTFSNGFTGRDFGLPGSGRDLVYEASCECYQYVGSSYPLR